MIGLLISYLFVFFVIGVASLLNRYSILGDEGSRKLIHVGVANWWIVAMFVFAPSAWYLAIIPPASFIVLNYLSFRFNLVKSMERDSQSTNDLGTVYYAVSLFMIAFLSFYFAHVRDTLTYLTLGMIPILVMGYGDGFGAVFGKKWGKKKIYQEKTLVGFLTMFLFSLIISMIGLFLVLSTVWLWVWIILLALLIALFAAVVELITPSGLDNLSVPLLIFLLLLVVV